MDTKKNHLLSLLKKEECSLKKQVRLEEESMKWAYQQYGSELAGPPSSFYRLTEKLADVHLQIAFLEQQCESVEDVHVEMRKTEEDIVRGKSEIERHESAIRVLVEHIRNLEKRLGLLVAIINMIPPQEE